MKIVTGEFKGMPIKIPKAHIRPTSDKVRQAVFNILMNADIGNALDLFAGSGAVGIEALSCGASSVVFVDSNRRCTSAIASNLARLKAEDRCEILNMDAIKAIKLLSHNGMRFDMIFSDPPYQEKYAKKSLIDIAGCDIVKRHGVLVIEHFKKSPLPEITGDLKLIKARVYGDTVLSLYRKV